MSDEKHLLLINLGKGEYKHTTYRLPDDTEITTTIAGLALWRWLIVTNRAPVSVVFACTGDAWQAREDHVRQQMAALSLPPERLAPPIHLEIPRSLNAVWAVLPPLERWLADHRRDSAAPPVLHMDLTHAYRAIPLAHTWMAHYLQRRGLIEVGVWGYGAFEPSAPDATPYLDLSHLLELAEWATAVSDFRRRFDTYRLGQLAGRRERAERARLAKRDALDVAEIEARRPLRHLFDAATEAGKAFALGLPIETGLAVAERLGNLTSADVKASGERWLPALAPVVEGLFDELHPLAIERVGRAPAGKEQLPLSRREIHRQLHLVQLWLRVGAVGDALRALRELVVNRVLLAQSEGGQPARWLDRGAREDAERLLNALRRPRPGEPPAQAPPRPNLAIIGDLWSEICNFRNEFAHAGMSDQGVSPDSRRQKAERLVRQFAELVDCDKSRADWSLPGVTPSSPWVPS